ncbi:MAG: hypothetical protein V4546_06610 [Bacteroidota bacterium]
MFKNYKKEVILDYQKKAVGSGFSPNLSNPKPAKLRDECLKVYFERPIKEDEATLRAFFDLPINGDDYSQSIRSVDIDKFKPLINFLQEKTNDTDDRNIELLAWLIDFELRPFSAWKNIKRENPKSSDKLNKTAQFFSTKKTRNITIATILVAGATLAGITTQPPKQCMYWTGERYQAIYCDQKIGNTPIIALDTFKVTNQKRITRPDTLTKSSLGKVWHIKIERDSAEFYTSGGNYPLNYKRELQLSSYYILNKYAFSKYKTIK